MSFRDEPIRFTGRWVGAVAVAITLSTATPSTFADMSRSSLEWPGDVVTAPSPYPYASTTVALRSHGPLDGGFDLAAVEDAYRSGISTTPPNLDDCGDEFGGGRIFWTGEARPKAHRGFRLIFSDEWVVPDELGERWVLRTGEDQRESPGEFWMPLADGSVAPDEFGALHAPGTDDFGVVIPMPEPSSVLMGGIAALLLTRRPRARNV